MSTGRLSNKRVLVTLPLTDSQKNEFAETIAAAGGHASFVREQNVADADIDGASIIIGNVPAVLLHASEDLEWLQTSSAGYDHYLVDGRLAPRTMLTNATGAYGQAVSEHMLASLLCLMKKIHLYRDNQRASLWLDEGPVASLSGARVLVLGTGDIGSAFARLTCALGAEAYGVRRNVGECPQPFSGVCTLDDLPHILGDFDVVACVLPSSPETRSLADASFFSAMKEGAFFVNAGRGDLVDSDALRRLSASLEELEGPRGCADDRAFGRRCPRCDLSRAASGRSSALELRECAHHAACSGLLAPAGNDRQRGCHLPRQPHRLSGGNSAQERGVEVKSRTLW